jgi:hypothetical protein
MQFLRLALVIAAVVAEAAGFIEERRRLAAVQRLPGREGRDLIEARRGRGERVMVVATVLLVAGAALSVVRLAIAG